MIAIWQWSRTEEDGRNSVKDCVWRLIITVAEKLRIERPGTRSCAGMMTVIELCIIEPELDYCIHIPLKLLRGQILASFGSETSLLGSHFHQFGAPWRFPPFASDSDFYTSEAQIRNLKLSNGSSRLKVGKWKWLFPLRWLKRWLRRPARRLCLSLIWEK